MDKLRRVWHIKLGRPFRLRFAAAKPAGEPRMRVLLLHGLASDSGFWQPLTIELAKRGCEVLAPDLLGHGMSPKPNFIPYSTDDQAEAVLALLRRKRWTDVTVVGHSMGSLVATRLAMAAPRRVGRLLLFEPPLYSDLPEFKTHARRRRFYYDIYERIAANPTGAITMARLVARISKSWSKYLASEQSWLPIERSLRNTVMEGGTFDELKNIAVQTDIVHGRLDVAVSRAELKKMLKHNEKITFHTTIERHNLSKGSARFLANLIAPTKTKDRHKKVKEKS
jgi:pimeloyl-ACP methyl ester carboxylesterase